MVDKSSTGKTSSAGGKHGSNAHVAGRDQTPSGLNENTGEFRIGENIILGMKNGNVNVRHSPQGDEVEVAEATLAGLLVDAFFTEKFGEDYPVVK